MNRKQRAWIAAAVQALRRTGSWTGRTHLHKHLFVVQTLQLADVPFEFELHHYGPYSFELDAAVAEMEAFGDLDKEYPQPGYGPSYELTEFGNEALAEFSQQELEAAKSIANRLQNLGSSDLELIATCLWVEVREKHDDPHTIVPRVQEIKPKYSLNQVNWALDKARELRTSVT